MVLHPEVARNFRRAEVKMEKEEDEDDPWLPTSKPWEPSVPFDGILDLQSPWCRVA